MGCDEFYLGISTFARAVAMTANGGKHMANRTGKSRLTGIVIAECLTCQLCEWTTNIWDRKQNEGVLNGTGIQVGSARERREIRKQRKDSSRKGEVSRPEAGLLLSAGIDVSVSFWPLGSLGPVN